MKQNIAVWITIVGLIAAWELLVELLEVPAFILPRPSVVVQALFEEWRLLLLVHLPTTLGEVFLGLLVSIVLGVVAAMAIMYTRMGNKVLYPLVIATQTIPIVALSPILIMWFGYSIWGKVAVTVLICFFPIVVGCMDGLRSTNEEWVQLMKTMGASPWQIFIKLQVPQAFPSFFSGLKIAGTVSVVGATIGE